MWQDSQIRFDTALSDMQVGHGEVIIDKLDMIEDVKGNVGDQGRLIHGNVSQALHILTVYKNYRYEFIFNNLNTKCTRHYTSVIGVYREIKLRGGFIQNKRLNILPLENISSTTPGVWNLSAEQGNVGTFIITNIRIVWFADVNYQFNVSLPYLAIADVCIKSSKFGPTLVITSAESNGSYVLGFRIDPVSKLYVLHKEITSLRDSYYRMPIYGVEYVFECQGVPKLELNENDTKEVQDIDDEISDVFGLYFSESEVSQRKPCFSLHLGLAAELPREGSSLQSLWELLPAT
ncbi:hypothetical protein PV326_006119 [Microctonus aethiopoides]|nr:hypothetical protein PV326_006119 [Microctonus aethiopoides]